MKEAPIYRNHIYDNLYDRGFRHERVKKLLQAHHVDSTLKRSFPRRFNWNPRDVFVGIDKSLEVTQSFNKIYKSISKRVQLEYFSHTLVLLKLNSVTYISL